MSTTASTIDGILKEVYSAKEIESMENREAKTWNSLKKSSKKPSGKGFRGPALVKSNQRGLGAQNELEALRTPASQDPQQWEIKPKVLTNTMRFSGLSLETATNDEDSFADTVTFETENGILDFKKELNAQTYRDGSGIIALVNGAVSASASVVFDNGVPTHFRVGQYVDIKTAAGAKEVDSIEITDIDISTNTLTLASAVTCTDNSEIYREDTGDSAPTDGKELAGLKLATDDGTISATYQGINRSTYTNWQGLSIDAGTANLSDDLLQRAQSRMKVLAGTEASKVCSNTSQFRKYMSILTPAKEFQGSGKMDSGHYGTVPSWNGLPWIVDTDCDFDRVYLLDDASFMRYDMRDVHLDDKTGSVFRWDSGFDAFVVVAKYYGNTGTPNPRKLLALKNLAEPSF